MKNTLKKVLFSLWAITLLWAGSIGLVNADTTEGMPDQNPTYKIANRGIDAWWDNDLLLNAIQLVNRVMSMLSVVALVVLLIGWYKMITANGDETKYKKWLTVLKQAAIWLVIIWLSWAIIRIIFRFIKKSDTTWWTADYNSAS
jgi:hypothetical protein